MITTFYLYISCQLSALKVCNRHNLVLTHPSSSNSNNMLTPQIKRIPASRPVEISGDLKGAVPFILVQNGTFCSIEWEVCKAKVVYSNKNTM